MAAKKGIDWDAQPLGEAPDTHIAAALDVDTALVWRMRRARGIPAFTEVVRCRFCGLSFRRYGCKRFCGAKCRSAMRRLKNGSFADSRGANWEQEPLGIEPDAQIARRRGWNPETVGRARRARGIGRFDVWEARPDLSAAHDSEIARLLGIGRTAVVGARLRRGIMKSVSSVCRVCGEPFTATRQRHFYCSDKCNAAMARHKTKHAQALFAALGVVKGQIGQCGKQAKT